MSRPIRVLNVAEKPSVAKSISAILSGNNCSSRAAHSQYNRVFEFLYTRSRNGQNYEMLVTSVTGHLMELDFTDQYRKWNSCDPVALYEAPIRKFVPQDKLNIKKTLEQEARGCQLLVLWLDCDLEGENIAFEVIEVCRGVNPRLEVKRAHFSDLTERRITAAWNDLKLPDQRKTDAVDVRQEIDLRIGASFTRFQTMLLKDKFVIDVTGNDRSLVLSYGPCQFPTLGFIVERYWEIQAHEPEEFWVINCSHTSEEGTATFNWMRGHMFDYTCAVMIYEMCVEEPTATVTNIREQERKKYPPYPLNTIELEKRASRYFRMSSEHTMKAAEELYQSGFISYPRTETDAFPENTDLHEIVHQQQGHPDWGFYAQRLLDPETGLWSNPSRGGHDDKAHPPIHPTKFSAGETTWTENHRKVYELVVRHFLACVSQPAVGAETTVEIDISGESFSVSGRVILERNYLDVYRFESWGASTIPKYVFGQQFVPTRLTLDSGVTRPPPLLSEADLLSCMDKEKIGTDATMHDHIKKLLDRFYATKDTSTTRFSPTNLGEALVMGYDDMGYELWKPYLRSRMEADMKKVEAGQKRKNEVLNSCLQQMKACFVDARLNRTKLTDAMAIFFDRSNQPGGDELPGVVGIVRRCGTCNESDMALKRKPDGHFMVGCLGYPQCRNVVWLPGPISEATVTTQPCNACSTAAGPVFRIQFKFRQLEIPVGYDVNHLGCIGGCDDTLRELIEMCGTGPRVARTVPAPMGRGRGAPLGNNTPQQRQNVPQPQSAPQRRQNVPQPQSAPPPRRRARAGGAETEGPMACTTCGEPCPLRTANTDTNRGRKFYSCQSRECNFFVWEDENSNGSGRGGTGRGNRGRGGRESASAERRGGRGRGGRRGANNNTATGGMFVSATGEAITNRCYTCGDPSHFANVCPNRQS